ncbi:retention module-containing protein [Vibrio sp. DW001]|uniref:retention module-containing protein n=1 Tax=Vibrio sp. DW001 TaxID=2912315 RepID=UPI0023B01BA0|nr:retention module-containing protein [Vibrio sp. DW001]WED28287.1 retention module-containing protein [Vibrio sp. DW001]
MNEQILNQNAIIESSTGGAILIRPGEAAKLAESGMQLIPQDILITPKNAEVIVQINGQQVIVDRNCVSCLAPDALNNGQNLAIAPVSGDINVDPTAVASELATLELDDIADIQAAILDGIDPTLALEATAAGGQGATSANAGFVTIDYTYMETLASTFFETQGFERTQATEDNDIPLIRPAEGGQVGSASITEGIIDSSSALQTSTVNSTVTAGNRPLDPLTFTFEDVQLETLLLELNSEVTSSGEPVVFRFDEATNSIVGVQGGETVITFALVTTSVGANVELSLTTTLEQPIDHNASIGSTGLVRFTDNNLSIDIAIQGQDTSNNSLVSPVVLTSTILDGQDQTTVDVDIDYTETKELTPENPTIFEGAAINIGSDYLQDIRFDEASTALFDDVLTNNQPLEAVLSDDGRTLSVYVVGEPNNLVLEATIALDGTYSITQYQVLEQLNSDSDVINFPLPITSVDFDGDVATNELNYSVNDGAGPTSNGDPDDITLTDATSFDGSLANAAVQVESVGFVAGTDDVESVQWDVSDELSIIFDQITSNGEETSWTLSDDKTKIEVRTVGNNTPVLTLEINSDLSGEYTVTQLSSIDQDANDQLEFDVSIVATDTDGDTSERNVNVSIMDGVNPNFEPSKAVLNDDAQEPQTLSLFVNAGSDAVASITFSELDTDLSSLVDITSNGNATEIVISDDGLTLTLVDKTGNTDVVVLTVTIDPTNQNYTILQSAAIDQVGVDANDLGSVLLNIPVIVEDTDGDTTTNFIDVTINDGTEPSIAPVSAELTDGVYTAQTQSLVIDSGVDAVKSITFSELDTDLSSLVDITSNGNATEIVISDDGLTLTLVDKTGNTDVVVLTVTIDPTNQNYTILQSAAIDQVGVDANDLGSVLLNIPVIVEDTDGDTTTNFIDVTINDGTEPSIAPVSAELTDGVYTAQTQSLVIDSGVDAVKSITFSELDTDLSSLVDITSNGNATEIVISDDGLTLTLVDKTGNTDVVVLTVTIDPTNQNYTILQSAAIDQVGVDANDLGSVLLNIPVIVEDTDGDTTTNFIDVTINDGTEPSIAPVSAELTDGVYTAQTQSLVIDSGVDAVKSITFSELDTDLSSLVDITSNGNATEIVISDDGLTLTLVDKTGNTDVVVLTVTIDPTNQNYTILQSAAIDQVGVDANDLGSVLLNIPVIVEDTDGDTTTNFIDVTINDGTEPSIAPVSAELTDGVYTAQTQSLVIDSGVDAVKSITFSELDTDLSSLVDITSNGNATEIVISDDGLTLTLVDKTGNTDVVVLTVTIDPTNQNYTILQSAAIDQVGVDANDLGSVLLNIPVIVEDTDGDTTTNFIDVTINDGTEPSIAPVSAELTDGVYTAQTQSLVIDSGVDAVKSITFSELDTDLSSLVDITSNGNATEIVISDDGLTLTLVDKAGNTDVVVLTVTIDPTNQNYTILQSAAIDQVGVDANDLGSVLLNIPVIVEDTDGDTTTNFIDVTINDGTEPSIAPVSAELTDGVYTAQTQSLVIDSGVDAVKSITFSELDTDLSSLVDITSNGNATEIVISDDGLTLTLVDKTGNTDVVVLTVTIDPTNQNYTILQSAAIDQVGVDANDLGSVLLNIPVIVEDTDGDTTTNFIDVTINDGTEPSIAPVSAELTDGVYTAQTQSLVIDSGVDAVKSITFSELDTDLSSLVDITSNGNATEIVISDDGLTLTLVDKTGNTDVVVLTVTIDPTNQNYTILQSAAIDQVGVDANDLGSVLLNIPVIVEDTDGDTTTNFIDVTINDGTEPSIAPVSAELTDGVYTAQTQSLVIDSGVDAVKSITFSELDTDLSSLVDITSNGNATEIVISDDGLTLTLVDKTGNTDVVVLTVTIDPTNQNYTILQSAAIDQVGVDANDLGSVLLNIPVIVEDTDGDTTTNFIDVTINDGTDPIISEVQNVRLEESGIDKTSGQVEGSSDYLETEHDSTTISVTQNVDNIEKFEVDLAQLNSLLDVEPILSGGREVVFIEVSTGVYQGVTYKNNGDIKDVVINVTVDNDDTSNTFGQVNFELVRAITHSIADGNDDEVTFIVPVIATDTDGDVATNEFSVTIVDDEPVIESNQEISLAEGSTRSHSINIFVAVDDDNDGKLDNHRGADVGIITETEYSGPANSEVELRLDSTSNSESNYTIIFKEQEIGTLEVKSGGKVTYTSLGNDIDTGVDGLDIPITFTATDRDGDTSTTPINIHISDSTSTIETLSASGTEDAGRNTAIVGSDNVVNDNDNVDATNAPIKVDFVVNVGDLDSNESLHSISISNNANGSFYYLDSSGNYIAVSGGELTANQIKSSSLDGDKLSLDNLYFVPTNDRSSGSNGFKYNISAVISRTDDNSGVELETISGRLAIDVYAIADTPTWRNLDTYESGTEDEDNIVLNIKAVTQDNNSETITYIVAFKDGDSNHTLELADGTILVAESISLPNGDVVMGYNVTSQQVKTLQVNPEDNFSGVIELEVTAISTENSNRLVEAGKEQAYITDTVVIDVRPVADEGELVVSRVNVDEDTAFLTQDHITVNLFDDLTDNSEQAYIELIGLPEGSVFSYKDGNETITLFVNADGKGLELDSNGNIIDIAKPVDLIFTYDVIQDPNTTITPPQDSNVDFDFTVRASIEDTAGLNNGDTVDTNVSIPDQVIHVDIKGIADAPVVVGNGQWDVIQSGEEITGIKTTIDENSEVTLNFAIETGEIVSPEDGSETISVVLSDAGGGDAGEYKIIDLATGNEVSLTYVGTENGYPKYEANVSSTNIKIVPLVNSTNDIHIIAKIIVTENDGNTRIEEKDIFIEVTPVISSADSYTTTSTGNEDTAINVNWYLNLLDDTTRVDNEFIASVTLDGGPSDVQVIIDESNNYKVEVNGGDAAQYLVNGEYILAADDTITITALDGTALTKDNLTISVLAPEDSSVDFKLNTELTVKEVDVDNENNVATNVINGVVNVVVNPVVEGDDEAILTVTTLNTDGISFDDGGDTDSSNDVYNVNGDNDSISFTINGEEAGANISIGFNDLDPSSLEQVSEIVIDLNLSSPLSDADNYLIDQLSITGAIDNGDGTWTVIDENSFAITAPDGLYALGETDPYELSFTVRAEVVDLGDENEGSAPKELSTDINVVFLHPNSSVHTNDLATTLLPDPAITPDTVIVGTEDNAIDLMKQLKDLGILNFEGANAENDVVSIVIDTSIEPFTSLGGLSINGEENFDNGKFSIDFELNEDGSFIANESLMLTLPNNYSGDFKLPITVVITDKTSGDENITTLNLPVQVTPVVDGIKETTLVVETTDSFTDNEPASVLAGKAYEDGVIHLNLTFDKLDGSSLQNEGGIETLDTVDVKLVDPSLGSLSFEGSLDSYGVGAITLVNGGVSIDASKLNNGVSAEDVLNDLIFTPVHDLGGVNVELELSGTMSDTTIFDVDGGTEQVSHGAVPVDVDLGRVSFDIVAVVDGVETTNADGSLLDVTISGDEDSAISLGNIGLSLDDSDGSEQFVSIKLTNVPDDFQLQVNAGSTSLYSVKNNGNGEWSIQLKGSNIEASDLDLTAIEIVPAEDFSGTVNLQYVVYTQEETIDVPVEQTGSIKLTVLPKGDDIDTRVAATATGTEGEDFVLDINAKTVDNQDSLETASGTFDYTENDVEKIEITISGVPEGALISLADADSVVLNADGTWTIIADSPVTQVTFNSADWNSNNWPDNGSGLSQIFVTVRTIDSDGVGGNVSYGDPSTITPITLDIESINDKPIIEAPDTYTPEINEDGSILINNIQIADPDSADIDALDDYVVTLSVNDSRITFDGSPSWAVDNGDGTYTLSNTFSEINALLTTGFTIAPNPDFNGIVSVSVDVNDGGNSGTDTGITGEHDAETYRFDVTVKPINDKPTIEVDNNNPAVIDEGGSILIDNIQIADIDSNDSDALNDYVAILSVNDSTVTFSGSPSWVVDNGDGTYTLTNSLSEINALLTTGFTVVPNPDFNGTVSVNVDVNDGGNNGADTGMVGEHDADTYSFDITVNAVNDAPVNTLFDSLAVDEGSVTKLTGLSVEDIDYATRPETTPITVTLSTLQGTLTSVIPGSLLNVTIDTSDPNQIIIQGPISEVNQLLSASDEGEGVFYTVSSGNTATTDTLTMITNDGGNYDSVGTIELDTDTTVITIAPVVAGIPELQLALQTQQIRTSVSGNLAAIGIPLIGLNANLVFASDVDTDETITIRISDLPDTASVTGATLSGGSWYIDADALDSAEIVGLESTASLSIVAIAEESGAISVESSPTNVNIVVVEDNTPDVDSDPQLIVASDEPTMLLGTDGADILVGGAGDDLLIGGAGDDILTGAGGADQFIWTQSDFASDSVDIITDFNTTEGDTINLSDLLSENENETLEHFLSEHVTASVSNNGNDVNLLITGDSPDVITQTIVVQGLGADFSSTGTELVNDLFDAHVFSHGG